MATNFNGNGESLTLIAPTGGVAAGVPVLVNEMVVVPLETVSKGAPFTAIPGGEWRVTAVAAGLKQGAKVGLKDSSLVAAATEGAVFCGYLTTDVVAGAALFLLVL